MSVDDFYGYVLASMRPGHKAPESPARRANALLLAAASMRPGHKAPESMLAAFRALRLNGGASMRPGHKAPESALDLSAPVAASATLQ